MFPLPAWEHMFWYLSSGPPSAPSLQVGILDLHRQLPQPTFLRTSSKLSTLSRLGSSGCDSLLTLKMVCYWTSKLHLV